MQLSLDSLLDDSSPFFHNIIRLNALFSKTNQKTERIWVFTKKHRIQFGFFMVKVFGEA